MAERAILGVVKTGGEIAKGTAGLVSMATQKSADDFRTGKTPPSSFVPIGDRYKTDPWYKRIPKQIGDALTLKRSDPEVQKHLLRTHGAWSNAVNTAANDEHSGADKSLKKIEPQLGTAGKVTNFASNLIPGVRALDIPFAIGEAKSIKGGIVPAIAAAATKKLPGDLTRNAVQQAIGDVAPKFSPNKPPPSKNTEAAPATDNTPDYFKLRKPAGITGARG